MKQNTNWLDNRAVTETVIALFARLPEHNGCPWRGCAIKTKWESVLNGFERTIG